MQLPIYEKQKRRWILIEPERQLTEWIDRYSSLIYSVCYKLTNHYFDAQDLTQDTFLLAYRKLSTFDGENERAWLCKIATNLCLDYLKHSSRRSLPTEDTYFQEIRSPAQEPLALIMEEDLKDRLLAACQSLKPPYDEVAADYFYRELTVQEISQNTGKNKKTVQTQIYRAKAMLKKLWGKELERV